MAVRQLSLSTPDGAASSSPLGACPRDVRRCLRLSEIARGVGSRRLFSNVSVDVQPGRHLLVMGNSGTGKSSMLRAVAGLQDKRLRTAPLSQVPAVHRRAVAGLWDRGSGDISRPHTADTMFLPQRPYCTLGSLRQQLVYPRTVDEWRAVNREL